MDVSEAVIKHRTIRAFKPEQVPETVIREVLEIARHAPSNSNTQPWRIDIVSGTARDELQAAIFAEMQAGEAEIMHRLALARPDRALDPEKALCAGKAFQQPLAV